MSHSKKTGAIALILAFFLPAAALQAAEAVANNPNIGKSDNLIYFEEEVVSANFQIWDANADPNTLKYTLHLEGPYAANFTIDGNSADVHGESNGVSDKKTHTVDVNYGQLHDIALNAKIAIKENNDISRVSYITLLAQAPPEPNDTNGPVSSPEIGRSSSRIALAGNVLSKRFQIWNKGTGTLSYTLSISGDDADYFTIDKEDGESNGVFDKQTHTVSVAYDDDFHNQTLNAVIEITDSNDNFSTINVTATETIATRVSYIAIEQNYNYDTDANEVLLYVDTDATVAEINLITPEGITRALTDTDYTENDDGSVFYWTYLDDDANLSDYRDGKYTIEVNYTDANTAQTIVNFGIPNKPGTILWPTQIPVLTYPATGEQTVSPVRFEWEKCADPNAGSVRLVLAKEDSNNSIAREYSKATKKTSAINLDTGVWDAYLSIGKWYQAKNDDGIEIEVGKCNTSGSNFEIMKWFGTLEDGTNHTLTLTDCSGTEVTFRLTGGGKGEIIGDCDFSEIILTDTTAKSVFSITTKKGAKTTVGSIKTEGIETAGDIRAIIGKNVNLKKNISIDGAAGAITLNNVTDSNITIKSAPVPVKGCALKFNEVNRLILTSETPVRTLQATKWLTGSLGAPWISTMTIKGAFDANLNLSGEGSPKAMTLKSARFAGRISGNWHIEDGNCGSITFASSTGAFEAVIAGDVGIINATGNRKTAILPVLSGNWQFGSARTVTAADIIRCNISSTQAADENTPAIGRVIAKGWIRNAVLTAAGDIGSISAGAIKDCNFTTTGGSLGKIENKGISNETYCFINSKVAAQHIGAATIGYPKYDNGDAPFGLTAGTIDKLTIRDSQSKQAWTTNEIGIDGITMGDLEIRQQ